MLTVIASINQFLLENLHEKQKEGVFIAKQAMELTGLKRNTFFNFVNQTKAESEANKT